MDNSAASLTARLDRTPDGGQPQGVAQQYPAGADQPLPGAASETDLAAFDLPATRYLPVKTVIDRLLAVPLLILSAPVILIAALLIRLTSRGPAFYRQQRIGKDGRLFTVLKLRTMIDGAEDETGPVWADIDDPRITTVGRFLRRTPLDELPQLLNVLAGQMSLIGPRPERPQFVQHLQTQVAYYSVRYCIRPGITGIAQLRLPPDRGVDCVRRKLIYDLYYIRHVGPWLDFRILLATAGRFTVDLVSTLCRPLWMPAWKQIVEESPLSLATADDPPPAPENAQ